VAGIRHDIHHARLQAQLRSPSGGVARDMLRRGVRVQSQARRNLAGASGPRRINHGLLRSTLYARPVMFASGPGARVGSELRYAWWVHAGTGLYGPRHTKITPKTKKVLAFTPKGAKGRIYVRSVKGMKPNPFLKAALPAAKG
jgi:hypothetical protein